MKFRKSSVDFLKCILREDELDVCHGISMSTCIRGGPAANCTKVLMIRDAAGFELPEIAEMSLYFHENCPYTYFKCPRSSECTFVSRMLLLLHF